MEIITDLSSWFAERLSGLKCSTDARAYVAGALAKQKTVQGDMSRESVVLAFYDANERGDFATYQRMGDWSLWVCTFHPLDKNKEVVETFGRLSYHACYRILHGAWPLYEELADELPEISVAARIATRA